MAKKSNKKNTKKQSSAKTLSIFGRKLSTLHLVSIAALLVFAGIGAYLTLFSSASTGDFVKVGTHPQASTQPTATGKTIAALKSWNGKIYAGYGDYGVNSGPVSLSPFDTASNTFGAPELTMATESISLFKEIGGKLYAPSIDPRGSDYAVNDKQIWQNPFPLNSAHAFDMVSLNGSDLWVIGSSYDGGATAWRSLDNGATWQKNFDMRPLQEKTCSDGYANFARFYGAIAHAGKLYVQAQDWCTGFHTRSKVFDGTTWSDGPNFGYNFTHGETFAGKTIFISAIHAYWGGGLKTFDGTTISSPLSGYFYDFTIDGDTLYALDGGGIVRKTKDLVNWTHVATGPTSGTSSIARSMTVHNGTVYLGGNDSSIYKHVPSSTTPPPPPSSGDTTAPTVTISQPANGATLGNKTNVQASASDNIRVTKMEIYIDGNLVKTSTSGSIKYGWSTRSIALGQHTVTVKASDAAGNVGQSSVTVNR